MSSYKCKTFYEFKSLVENTTGFKCYESMPSLQEQWYGTSDMYETFKEIVFKNLRFVPTGSIVYLMDTKTTYMLSVPNRQWLGDGSDPYEIPDESDNSDLPDVNPITYNGYWQLKTTQPYKYVVIGTDDSTGSDPYIYRLIRTYGLKYTSNVIVDNLDNPMSNDNPTGLFTDSDAPSLFPNNTTVKDFVKTLAKRSDAEVSLHGTSARPLIDTTLLTDSAWTTIYNSYQTSGGALSLDAFKNTFMETTKSFDVSRGASYVSTSKTKLEQAINKKVTSGGIWGGNTCIVDGVSVSVQPILSANYDWKALGFDAFGYWLVGNFNSTYAKRSANYDYIRRLQRDSGGFYSDQIDENLTAMHPGDCIELFVHNVSPDSKHTTLKAGLAHLKELQDQGMIKVVTRSEYAAMGEYVTNPIVSMTVTRSMSIVQNTEDSNDAYEIVCTHLDGSTSTPQSDVVFDRSELAVDTVGNYIVSVSYRGLYALCTVSVTANGGLTTTEPTLTNWTNGTNKPKFYNGYNISSSGSLNPTAGALYDTSDIYPVSSSDQITVEYSNCSSFTASYFTNDTISRTNFVSSESLPATDYTGHVLTIPENANYIAFSWHSKAALHDSEIASFSISNSKYMSN